MEDALPPVSLPYNFPILSASKSYRQQFCRRDVNIYETAQLLHAYIVHKHELTRARAEDSEDQRGRVFNKVLYASLTLLISFDKTMHLISVYVLTECSTFPKSNGQINATEIDSNCLQIPLIYQK